MLEEERGWIMKGSTCHVKPDPTYNGKHGSALRGGDEEAA